MAIVGTNMTDEQLAIEIAAASAAKCVEQSSAHKFIDPIVIKRRCWNTGNRYEIIVERQGWEAYHAEDSVLAMMDCMPYLTLEEESLLTSFLSLEGLRHLGLSIEVDEAYD